MVGNVDSLANPHTVEFGNVVQEFLQRNNSPWSPEEPAMHAHAHHFRGLLAFGIQGIKGVAQIDEEIFCLRKSLR